MKKTILGVVLSGLLFSGAANAQLWPFSSSSDSKEGEGVGSSESITNSESMASGKRTANIKTLSVHTEIIKSLRHGIPEFFSSVPSENHYGLLGITCTLGLNDPNSKFYKDSNFKSFTDFQASLISQIDDPNFKRYFSVKDFKYYRYICGTYTLSSILNEIYSGWPESANEGFLIHMKSAVIGIPYFEQVAEQAQNKTFKTEADFYQFAGNLAFDFFSDDDTFYQLYKYIFEKDFGYSPASYTVDLTGKNPAPIHFTWRSPKDGLYDFEASNSGVLIHNGGTAVLGNGFINGKKYEINISNERGLVVNKSRAVESASSTLSSSSNAAAAGVQ